MQRSTSNLWIRATRRACTAASLAIAFAAGGARAQNVLLSEVRADAGGRWVELHNRTAAPVDISSWSLHFCSRTPGAPQTYWWPFPTGTVIAADGYLKVNWYQTGVNLPGAPELWTGTSPYAFLFGLGGEPLTPSRGALALFSSQVNEYMNTASTIVDWVSWGEHAFPREDLAVSVGLWATGRHVPAIPTGQSIARDPDAVGTVAFPDLAWFVDNTPTPLQPNVGGAVVQSHGASCVLPGHHLLGLPVLQTNSLPLIGSTTFALDVTNTTGIPGEFVLVAFSTAGVAPSTPSILPPFGGIVCHHEVDLAQFVTTWIAPTQILGTTLPMPLSGLTSAALGAELHAQALVLDLMPNAWPPFQGTTNGLRLVVGQ